MKLREIAQAIGCELRGNGDVESRRRVARGQGRAITFS
jgi:hypothetical protein